jgi:hypothetical protein
MENRKKKSSAKKGSTPGKKKAAPKQQSKNRPVRAKKSTSKRIKKTAPRKIKKTALKKANKSGGKRVRKAAPEKTKNKAGRKTAKRAVKKASEYVAMPGGFKLRSMVKLAPRKGKTREANLSLISKEALITDVSNDRGELEGANGFVALDQPGHEVINIHWVATAGWDNITGKPVFSFTGKMIVPQPPVNKNGQSIFIFIGMQAKSLIVQPILQWGDTGMGGGAFWAVGSCLASSQFGIDQRSELTRVNPGRELKAVIQLRENVNNTFDYTCFFEGIDKSRLNISGIVELRNCCATLESYNVTERGDYPPVVQTAITELVVKDRDRVVIPAWQTANPGPLGEHAIVSRIPGNLDEIDLHYANA